MNKKIISLLVCFILLMSMMISACATDVSRIQPNNNGTTIVIVAPDKQYSSGGPTPPTIYQDGNTTIVIPHNYSPYYYTDPVKEETTNNTEETKEETTTEEVRPDNVLAGEVFDLINYNRVTNGVENLKYNKDLQEAADIRAKEAAESFSHTRPDGTDFSTAITVDFTKSGENLLLIDKVIADYEVIVDTWMNSAGHKANILDKDFHSTAIGISEKDDIYYIAQLFLN